MSNVITLTTDFGIADSFVAQMKGVIVSLFPEANIIDITHEIPPCDIGTAARLLKEAIPLYPPNSIHVGVVDPGVGGKRKRLIIEAQVRADYEGASKRVWLVGPDNGLFSLVAPRSSMLRVWEIENMSLLPRFGTGTTFEGRNIFAPVAALLAAGRKPEEFGTELGGSGSSKAVVEFESGLQPISMDGIIKGQIIYFDHFGNASTNITKGHLGAGKVLVSLPKKSLTLELRQRFEEFEPARAGCIINSQGYLEIVMNQASAKECLGLELGDLTQVTFG